MRRAATGCIAILAILALAAFNDGGTYSGKGTYPGGSGSRDAKTLQAQLCADRCAPSLSAAIRIGVDCTVAMYASYEDAAPGHTEQAWECVAQDTTEAAAEKHQLSASPSWEAYTDGVVHLAARVLTSSGDLIETVTRDVTLDAPGEFTQLLICNALGYSTAAIDSGWVAAIADTATTYDARECATASDGRHAYISLRASDPDTPCDRDKYIFADPAALAEGPGEDVGIIYYDMLSIPEGARIVNAHLILTTYTTYEPPCPEGAYHAVALMAWPEDEWMSAPAQDGNPWTRATTYAERDTLTGDAWYPPIADRGWLDMGIQSEHVTTPGADSAAVRYDVTDVVQYWSDYRDVVANNGFVPVNTTGGGTVFWCCGPDVGVAASQPLLVVEYSTQDHTPAWGGDGLPFAFTTDDGDTANVRWAEIAEEHGTAISLCLMNAGVDNGDRKLTTAQVQALAADGNEIVQHTYNHLSTWGLAEIRADADSMATEIERSWLAAIADIDTAAITALAYPCGGIDLYPIQRLVDFGYAGARASSDGEVGGMPPWSQSGKSTYLSWLDPTNIYATALTDCSTLVGGDGTDPDYDDIKLLVRHYSNVVLNQGFAATAVLAHDLKSDSHYLRGIDYDELGWLYTALEAEGIYKLTTYGEALAEYRAAHQATYPTSAFAVSAYDSMVTAGHDQFRYVWWTLP